MLIVIVAPAAATVAPLVLPGSVREPPEQAESSAMTRSARARFTVRDFRARQPIPRYAMEISLGRWVFGAASLAGGIVALVWPDYSSGAAVLYASAIAQIVGGVLLPLRRTAKAGAALLGAAYVVFAAQCVPAIVAAPLTFSGWGNFFEQFTLVVGAALVFAREALRRIGRVLVGVCALSFALYQAFYLPYTATLVPAWLPPGQMFWTVATTVAFALAALALLIDRVALLATRLMTAMIVRFGLLVWVPALVADPRSHSNWNEFVENFAIAGTVWILADILDRGGPSTSSG